MTSRFNANSTKQQLSPTPLPLCDAIVNGRLRTKSGWIRLAADGAY